LDGYGRIAFRIRTPPVPSGATRDEELKNVKEAIRAYVESLQKHNEPVPPSISEEIATVEMTA